MSLTLEDYKKRIKEALSDFGTYTFSDKGPEEVMDMNELERDLRARSAEDAAKLLVELNKGDDYAQYVATGLLVRMQDWDALFEQPDINTIDL